MFHELKFLLNLFLIAFIDFNFFLRLMENFAI